MKLDTLQFSGIKSKTALPVLKEKNKNNIFYSLLFQVPGQENCGLFFNEKSASKNKDGQQKDNASIDGTIPLKAGMSAIFAGMFKGPDAKEIKQGYKTTKTAETDAANNVKNTQQVSPENAKDGMAEKNNNPGLIKTNTAQIIAKNIAGGIENITKQDASLISGSKPAGSTENNQKPEGMPGSGIEFLQPGFKNIFSKPELNAFENIGKLLEYGNAGKVEKAGSIKDQPSAEAPSLQLESSGEKESFSNDMKNLPFFYNLKVKDSPLYSYTESSAHGNFKLKNNVKELKDTPGFAKESAGINSGITQDISAGNFISKNVSFAERLSNLENISSAMFETIKLYRPQGARELELDLEPEYLGKLKIKVSSRNEKIDIVIKASVAHTGDLLRDNIQALKDSLAERGLALNQVSVGMEEQHTGRGHSFSGFGDKNGLDSGINNITGRALNDNATLSIMDIANIGSDKSLYVNKLI